MYEHNYRLVFRTRGNEEHIEEEMKKTADLIERIFNQIEELDDDTLVEEVELYGPMSVNGQNGEIIVERDATSIAKADLSINNNGE